jgi:dihydropyrimidinase
MPLDLAIRGGQVVLESGALPADVLVHRGVVAGLVAPGTEVAAARQIDASGALVLPGGVDVHTHVGISFGEFRTRDRFGSATRAAALGGTTTLLEFAFPEPGETPEQAVRRRIEEATGEAVIDFGFHCAIAREARPADLAGVAASARLGAPSVKVFTAYRGLMMLELGDILAVMRAASRARSLVMVHAESETIVERASADLRAQGRGAARDHAASRPSLAELEAARSVLGLAEESGAAVYLVHVTLPEVAEEIRAARARGVRAYGETCPHYLLLDDSVYRGRQPELFVCSPPMRSRAAARRLWSHLGLGLTGIHSDHCCFDSAQKAACAEDSSRVPPGLPGVQTRLPLLISEALGGRLPISEVVRLCSTQPARLFGLTRKGSLLPGMDADLAIVDPNAQQVAGPGEMETDYSPFQGRKLRGRIDTVLAAGRVLVEGGRWRGAPAAGRFLRRSRHRDS